MKTAKRHSWLRALLVTVCAVLGGILFALGVMPKGVFAFGADGSGTQEPSEKTYELTAIDLAVREGYAFTSKINDVQRYDLVEVTVTFTEKLDPPAEGQTSPEPEVKTEKLVLEKTAGATRAAIDSETVNSVTFAYADQTITATVNLKEGYTAAETIEGGTLAVTEVEQKVIGIAAKVKEGTTFTLTSSLKTTDVFVVWAYNDGTMGEFTPDKAISNDCYRFTTANLFPDELKDVGATYSKSVGIILNDFGAALPNANGQKYETNVTVEGIQPEAPTAMASIISGDLLPHQARSKTLNMEGLTVQVTFGTGKNSKALTVPLTAFDSKDFSIKYYNEADELQPQLTTAVTYCEITLTYPNTTWKATGYPEIEVTPISIAAPSFPDNSKPLGYFNGVNIDIAGLDFSDQYTPAPQIYINTSSQNENAGDFSESGVDKDTRLATGSSYNLIFNKPGISYTVLVTLPDGGDFQWQAPQFANLKDFYTLEYIVQVEKGTYKITLGDTFEWTYGDAKKTGTVTGDLLGTEQNENQTFTHTETIPSGEATGYEYHLEWFKEGKWSTTAPTDAGKYQVKAISHETEFYKSSESNELDVTISPKLLVAADYIKTGNVYARGVTYSGTQVLKDEKLNDSALSDLFDVVAGTGTTFPIQYYKEGGYFVVLKLKNTNYVLKEITGTWNTLNDLEDNRTSAETPFTIDPREIKYVVSQGDFYYGKGSTAAFSANLEHSDDQIYLGDPAILYTYTGTTVTYSNRTNIDEWDVGNYTVSYKPTPKNSNKKEENDSLDLQLVSDTFKISKAQVNLIDLTQPSKEYKPGGYDFTINASASQFAVGGLGAHETINEVIGGTVTGARADFTQFSIELGTKFNLENADTYTVTLTLKDTKNFVWMGGGENPTATWTITKKALDQVVKPTDNLTYDHADHVLNLTHWDKNVMTQSVTGPSNSGTFDEENGTFTLKNAGTYSFTFTLRYASNYEWKGNETSETVTFDFVLKQATADLYQSLVEVDFNDKTKPSFAIPQALKHLANSALKEALSAEELSFVFTVTNEEGKQVATNATIVGKKVDASGDYTYTIMDFTGTEADNYAMPAGGLTFTFNVKSQDLVIPTFRADKDNIFEYNGAEQSILTCITNYAEQDYDKRIVITIKKGSETVSSGSDPKVQDVYLVDEEVAAYSATVKPAPNYKWNVVGTSYAEDYEFPFTFTVNQFGLTVTWTKNTLETVYDTQRKPEYSLDKFGTDEVSIDIGYKNEAHAVIDDLTAASGAGNYFVYAAGLEGAQKGNYSLKTNEDTAYTIKKQTIVKPLQNGAAYTGTFGNGTTASGNLYGNQNSFDPNLLSASVEGYRPAEWFGLTGASNNVALTFDEATTKFDVATGIFHYVNAGYYKVTFTINDRANYCWVGETDTDFTKDSEGHSWSDFAKIERQTLTAPKFGSFRAQEWEKFDATNLAVANTTAEGVEVTVQYGTRSGKDFLTYDTDLQNGVKGGNTFEDIGQYYILVSVKKNTGIDILNYVWKKSDDFKDVESITFVNGKDTFLYEAGERGAVAIRLHYAITSTQLPLSFNPIEYTFGDNHRKTFFEYLKFDPNSDSETNFGKTTMSWNESDITIIDLKFMLNGVEVSDLENELPWDANASGQYYIANFKIQFKDTSYQNLPVESLHVTVKPRPIELEWNNLSKVYDGSDEITAPAEKKTVTVRMINMPMRGGENVTTTLLIRAEEGAAKDVGNYKLYVELSGANSTNFTTDGALNNYTTVKGDVVTNSTDNVPFTITPYAFTATAKNASVIYGEKLPSGPDAWEVSNDAKPRPEKFDEDIKNIQLSFWKDGVEQTGKISVGEYSINLAWSSAEAGKNYNVNFGEPTATLTVTVREIAIALNTNDKQKLNGTILSSIYFDDPTSYTIKDYAFTAAFQGTEAGAIVAGDHPFNLCSAVTQNSDVNAAGYSIKIKVTDGNYKVTVLGTTYTEDMAETPTGYKHVIIEATLTPKIAVNAGGTYDNTQHAYLTKNDVKGSTNADLTENANNAQWFIFKAKESTEKPAADAEGWLPYDAAGEHFGKDAKTYYFYVRVTAKNHTTVVSEKYSFTIKDATLSDPNGIISGSHVYNANPYAYLSETHTVTGVNLGEEKGKNATNWFIAKVDSENATTAGVTWVDYAAATHSRTNFGKDYFFVKITAKNHNDLIVTATDGKPFCLDITKATLTVSANMSIFFNEENPATADYYMESGKVTVDKLKQGYADGIFSVETLLEGDALATLAGLSGTFTYSVNYTKGTSGVGNDYAIKLDVTNLSSDNYKFTAQDGALEVKRLPVSVSIENKTATYGDTGLQLPEATVTTSQAPTYGTGTIDIFNLINDKFAFVTVKTDALVVDGSAYTTNNVKRNGSNEVIGYDITATPTENIAWSTTENDWAEKTVATYTINPAENEITTADYEFFTDAFSWTGSKPENAEAAWVYGKFADDGYKAEGRHAPRAFVLLSRDNPLKIKLAFNNGTPTEATVASDEDIQLTLARLFKSWGAFNAGIYTVTYQMEASNNYNKFEETWSFTVAKRAITVTPNDQEVTYGDPFTGEFTYQKSSDLDGYGDEIEQITDIVTNFSFGTVKGGAAETYAAGWRKDVYEIKVLIGGVLASYDGDSYTDETANYVFTFGTGDFNVKAREVTVTIKEAFNHYMLVGDYHYDTKKYDVEKWADLDYEIDGTLFDDVVPFTLRTAALINEKTTKAVGKYAIYAVYNDEEAKNNYTITIGNKAFASGVDTDVYANETESQIIKNNGVLYGGVFSVEKAVLHAERSGPYFKLDPTKEEYTLYQGSDEALYMAIYDGREKYYFATTNVDRDDLKPLVPTFTPVYTQVGNAAFSGVPKNVGTYHVSFVPDVANSNFADLSVGGDDIVIGPRPLSVTPSTSSDTERVYNGNPYSVTFTFNTLVGEEVLGLNVTVNGKASDRLFTVTGPSAGANRNVFAVSATKAGTYKVKAQLSGAGMNNYSIANNLYEYDLVIKSAGLFVVVQKATIEYGTPLTPNSLFKVAYSLSNDKATETDPALGELIQSNIASGAFTKPESFTYVVGMEGNGYSDGKGGTASNAGSTFGVTISNIQSDNYTVTVITGELEVVQRKIFVNVYGVADKATRGDIAHNVYDGNNHSAGAGGNGAFKTNFENNKTKYLDLATGSSFGNSGMSIQNLGVMLRIQDTAIDAGLYRIYADDIDPNFEIEFRYNNSVITDENRPRYQIDHRPLTAKVQGADTSYVEAKCSVSVIYGDEAAQSLFTVCYSGWVAGQESKANEKNVSFGIGGYLPYTSQVGQTYEISMIGLTAGTNEFANYDLKLVGATLNITPRPIGASTNDEDFNPDIDDYHGGAWGLPVEAKIAFTGVAQERMNDLYTLSYDTTVAGDSVATAGTAPVKVRKDGCYHVTVTLKKNTVAGGTYYNYTFGETTAETKLSETLNYSILKKEVNLVWSGNTFTDAATVYLNGGFVDDVMTVVSFTVGENAVAKENYSATNKGFNVAVAKVNGTYTITVELKETATANYQLVEIGTNNTKVPIDRRVTSFTVDIEGNRVTVIEFITNGMGSWTYSEAAKEPKAQVKRGGPNGDVVTSATVIFDYVLATAPEGTEINSVVVPADGWYDYTQWKAVVSDAGKYLVRARYLGSSELLAANPVYYYFEIAKKQLTKPTIKDADSYIYQEKSGAGYIEGEIASYDNAAMQIASSAVQASYADGAMKLFATGKGEFAIQIALTDTNNYVWVDQTTGNVNLTWNVKPATDNTLAWNDSLSTVAYADAYSLVANSQKYVYHLNLAYAYTARTDGEEAPAAGASWTMGLPVNAGKYWVRATGISPEGNYNTATCDRAFKINKIPLTLNPSGAMTFGNTFSGTDYAMNSYKIHEGLANGDTEQMIMRDLKNIVYKVTDAPAEGLWQVKNYRLAIEAEATNYDVQSLTGTFTVNKARLFVTIGNNASSLYKRATDVSAATVSLRGTVAGDDEAALKDSIKALFTCAASNTAHAGRYEISLSANEIANYTLSVTNGVYTINRLPVRVEANWGGYDYGATPVLPSITKVFDGTTELTLSDDELREFNFVYAGSDGVPTAAGEHIVSVYIAETSNYTLATPASGRFVIRQTVLDADLIVWTVSRFDTVIIKPAVDHIKDGAFTTDMFDVSFLEEDAWDHAGVAYTIVLTLKKPDSTKWKSVEGAVRTLTYTVARGENDMNGSIEIADWVYGDYSADKNLPTASVKFGTPVFEYSKSPTTGFTTSAPVDGDAGEYWVRAVVEGTSDYERYESPATKFEITPKIISAPAVSVITEGYGQNNVYTGVAMQADVTGYDSTRMFIRYDDGMMIVNGSNIKLIATNAGTYHASVTLANKQNYIWEGTTKLDDNGDALLTWTIARKKLALPTPNDVTLIVNGQELTYYPIGFDSSVMKIEKNTSGYGGTFTAIVTLLDTDNYEWDVESVGEDTLVEWENGAIKSISFEWHVVGGDTVFIVIITILSILTFCAAVVGAVEGVFYSKKKKEEKQKAQAGAGTKEA